MRWLEASSDSIARMRAQKSAIRFEAAGPDQLEVCLRLRHIVFVDGQGVSAAIEFDGLDADCLHFLAWQDGTAIGTARLREVDGHAKAERVAVLEDWRGFGAGVGLMARLEDAARARGHREVMLHAQEVAIGFYDKLGYEPVGERFMEADIPHLEMRKALG